MDCKALARNLAGRLARPLSHLGTNKEGAAGILLAASMPPLICAAAISVDLGSLYLAERRLQGVADAAAMAAVNGDIRSEGSERALSTIENAKIANVALIELTPGTYTASKDIAVRDRFAATSDEPTAARVLLEQHVPLFFGKAITGSSSSTIRAQATAQRTEIAAYSLGTSLANFSGGIGNEMLSALAGTELNLSVLDTQGLVSTEIDVLGFADALKGSVGTDMETYGEVFGRDVPIDAIVMAMADASTSAQSAEVLRSIATMLEGRDVRLAQIIDLGPYARRTTEGGSAGVTVDAYSLLRSVLELSMGDSYSTDFSVTVPGVGKVAVNLAGGSGMRSSPWLTITQANDYVLRTSQMRMMVDVQAGGTLGTPKIYLPLFMELAEAEARLTDIECTGDKDEHGVTLQVTPSVGTLALGEIDRTRFPDLSQDLAVEPASLITSPVVSLTGYSEVDLGGANPQSVRFNLDEIAERTIKTVGTNDVFAAVASSLIEQIELDARVLGLGIGASAITASVGETLSTIAPALDALVFETTQAAGVKVGAADTRVDMARCGLSRLVA